MKVVNRFLFAISLLHIGLGAMAQNLLINPDFELGNTGWGTYTPVPAATQFSLDNTTAHSGTTSAKIISTLTGTEGAAFFQSVRVTAGSNYEYSYWVKTDSIEKYLFSLVIFKDSANNDIARVTNPIAGLTSNWSAIKCRFKPPINAATVLAGIFIMNTGTLWVDDAMLTELKDTTYAQFSVNMQSGAGGFKKLLGTNMGPVNPYSFVDYTPKFREIGIDFVRTHDYHIAFDFHTVFPDTSRNPLDSTAYNFTKTDACVADIINAGAKVLFRLGESADTALAYRTPPADMEKWAQVAAQIVKHYNLGWNRGFNYNIQYWEIWNEPDLQQFWTGTPEQYFELYRITAAKIKNLDSTLKVGGPTFAVAYDTRWINLFLDSVVANNTPLDFFSYHLYDLFNPYTLKTVTDFVKQKLLSAGLTNTELILDEWNPHIYTDLPGNYGKDDELNAASTVSGLHYLQQAPIDKLFRYATDSYDFPLFKWDNTYSYQGYAYKAVGSLIRLDNKLATAGGDSLGTTISASSSAQNDSAVILIANNSSSALGYGLTVAGINAGETWDYKITRIDSLHKYQLVKSGRVTSASAIITERVKSPFVDHIELLKSSNTDVAETQSLGNVLIYPNPAHDRIMINAAGTEMQEMDIAVTNVEGRELIKPKAEKGKAEIDLSSIPAGLYFIKIKGRNETLVRKICKQ